MSIIFHEESKTFHLFNDEISYIICVLPNGHIGNLYFGKKIHDREDFSYLIESKQRPMTACVYEGNRKYSLEHLKLEYPVYGTSDYRNPAVEILQENGSRISEFKYISYEITDGKPELAGLPATYVEKPEEAQTLCLRLKDEVTGIVLELLYSIFSVKGILARSARFINEGSMPVHLLNAMSLSLDLPDSDYVWMQFSGAWARERHIIERKLEQGIQAVGSIRGNSSHEHNPFIVLRRPSTTETSGEVMGFSLVYSGNHRMQAEVDTHNTARVTAGINPQNFDWKLDCGESFQTPEAVVIFSDQGLNGMSQTFHKLYQKRLSFAGIDPEKVLRKYVDRVRHVHLKDLRKEVVEKSRKEKWSFLKGVREGTFTVPGDGDVDFGPIFKILEEADYEGWVVVEAEQDPAKANPLEYAMKARKYIAEKTGL